MNQPLPPVLASAEMARLITLLRETYHTEDNEGYHLRSLIELIYGLHQRLVLVEIELKSCHREIERLMRAPSLGGAQSKRYYKQ